MQTVGYSEDKPTPIFFFCGGGEGGGEKELKGEVGMGCSLRPFCFRDLGPLFKKDDGHCKGFLSGCTVRQLYLTIVS